MKKILLAIIISSLFLSLTCQANVREYRTVTKEVQWSVQAKEQDNCQLTQVISDYGIASFYQRSGHDMLFKLRSSDSIMNDMDVSVFVESMPWQHSDPSRKIGRYNLAKQSEELDISEPDSNKIFHQLELGKMLVLQYFDKELQQDLYKYFVSPMKFREQTSKYKQCLSTLFEYDPDFIKDFNIYFDFNKHHLSEKAKKNLSYVAEHLNVDGELIQVRIDAHADGIGRRRFNDKLSKKRAETIKDFLISQGVEEHKVYFKAHGERKPLYDNETELGRSKNRHAQIQLLTTPPPPPEVKVKVVQEPKAVDFKPTDAGSTPVPNFINMDHLINRP